VVTTGAIRRANGSSIKDVCKVTVKIDPAPPVHFCPHWANILCGWPKAPVKSSPTPNVLQVRCPSCRPTYSVRALTGKLTFIKYNKCKDQHSIQKLLTPYRWTRQEQSTLTAFVQPIFFHIYHVLGLISMGPGWMTDYHWTATYKESKIKEEL